MRAFAAISPQASRHCGNNFDLHQLEVILHLGDADPLCPAGDFPKVPASSCAHSLCDNCVTADCSLLSSRTAPRPHSGRCWAVYGSRCVFSRSASKQPESALRLEQFDESTGTRVLCIAEKLESRAEEETGRMRTGERQRNAIKYNQLNKC